MPQLRIAVARGRVEYRSTQKIDYLVNDDIKYTKRNVLQVHPGLPYHVRMFRDITIDENTSTAEHAVETPCRAADTPVSSEMTTNMFIGMRNNLSVVAISTSHCMRGMTNRRTMFVRDDHASEHALGRIVYPHTRFENAKCPATAQSTMLARISP